jgi:chromosome partitioning protein
MRDHSSDRHAYANDGLLRTLPSIKYVQEGLNKNLLLQGVLFTINDKNKTTRKINELIRSRLGGTVYRTEIPRDNTVIEAATARLPVCVFASAAAPPGFHRDSSATMWPSPPKQRDVTPHSSREQASSPDPLAGVRQAPARKRPPAAEPTSWTILYGDRTRMERGTWKFCFFIEPRCWRRSWC